MATIQKYTIALQIPSLVKITMTVDKFGGSFSLRGTASRSIGGMSKVNAKGIVASGFERIKLPYYGICDTVVLRACEWNEITRVMRWNSRQLIRRIFRGAKARARGKESPLFRRESGKAVSLYAIMARCLRVDVPHYHFSLFQLDRCTKLRLVRRTKTHKQAPRYLRKLLRNRAFFPPFANRSNQRSSIKFNLASIIVYRWIDITSSEIQPALTN